MPGDQSLCVGQRIRVLPATPDGLARRALILAFDGPDQIELEYEKAESEEAVVPSKRCIPLLAFEAASSTADAEERKLNGNALFKLRDASAAIEQYVLGLRCLSESPSAGARCLIRPADSPSGAVRSALVLTVEDDGRSVDLVYEPDAFGVSGVSGEGGVPQRLQALLRQAEKIDDGGVAARSSSAGATKAAEEISSSAGPSEGGGKGSWWPSSLLGWGGGGGSGSGDAAATATAEEEQEEEEEEEEEQEEDGVPRERIVMTIHAKQAALQCALLLNAAKCSLLQRDWPSALARATRAERIAAHDATDRTKAKALRRTALLVAARAALGMQRFGRATTYAARLLAAPPPDDPAAAAAKEVRTLLRDIHKRAMEVKQSNKRLAKSLHSWVAAAMAESDQAAELDRALELT